MLVLASCVSTQTVRHRSSHQVDAQPVVPVAQPIGTQVPISPSLGKVEAQAPEPVVSARPLVSQVRRAQMGTWQAAKQQALDSLCRLPLFETTQLGLYVYDLTDGQPLYAVNAAQRMRPASCQKVVTAITA